MYLLADVNVGALRSPGCQSAEYAANYRINDGTFAMIHTDGSGNALKEQDYDLYGVYYRSEK